MPDILGGTAEDFWKDMADRLAECDRVMAENDWVRTAERSKNFPSDRTAELYSDLWYAGQIGFLYWNFLKSYRQHDPNTAMIHQAMQLGALIKEWSWRANYKPSIVTGAGQRKHLTELRTARNRKAKASVAQRRAIVTGLLPKTNLSGGALVNWLRKRLKDDCDISVSARTVRRDLEVLRG